MVEPGADALLHRSQRVAYSCSECTRRKIRCDKEIPCKPCISRGASQGCQRIGSSVEPRQSSIVAPRLAANDVANAIDQLQRRVDELERRLGASKSTIGLSSETILSNGQLASPSSALSSTTPTANNGIASDGTVEQAVTYEYLALGKDRNRGMLGPSSRHFCTDHTPVSNILKEPRRIPLESSITQALLPKKALDYVLTYADDVVAWQHACIHLPTFRRQVDLFLQLPSDHRWTHADPLWLALFFVIQGIAVHQMNPQDNSMMSILDVENAQQQSALTDKLLDAALKCFDAGRYLFEPSFFTCQAIAILCVCGHNVTDSYLLSSLLALGIKTAQTLNLHTLGGEDARMRLEIQNELADTTAQAWRNQVLSLEMAKRIWWSLVQQDYLAIPFRGVATVHPRDHDTPIPMNLDDDDISCGRLKARSDSELTLVSKLRFTSQTADTVCRFFQGLPRDSREGYATLKTHVEPYEMKLLSMLPSKSNSQFRSLNPSFQFGAAIRRYLNVSLRHKVLVLHRAFCSRETASEIEKYVSQEKCLEMARQILDQCKAMQNSSRPEGHVHAVWTISYHAVAAACVLGLQLFPNEEIPQTKPLKVKRREVEEAQSILLKLGERSSIASRGVELLSRLLDRYDENQEAQQPSRKRTRYDVIEDKVNMSSDPIEESTLDDPSFEMGREEEEGPADYQDILSMFDTMPDVYRLFDGSLGQPFTNDYIM